MAKIDKNKCIGCAICASICPEGVEIVNGKARIKNPNADCFKEAAQACPRKAIILDDEEGEKNDSNKKDQANLAFSHSNLKAEPTTGQGRGFGFGRMGGIGLGRGRGQGRGFGMRRGQGRGRGRRGY